jgi:arginine deiminase
VVIGYDRNDKTLEAFRTAGFRTIRAHDLLDEFEVNFYHHLTINNGSFRSAWRD